MITHCKKHVTVKLTKNIGKGKKGKGGHKIFKNRVTLLDGILGVK